MSNQPKSPEEKVELCKQVLQPYLDVDKAPLKGHEWILDAMFEYGEKLTQFTPNLPEEEEIERILPNHIACPGTQEFKEECIYNDGFEAGAKWMRDKALSLR